MNIFSSESFLDIKNKHILVHWQESIELIYITRGSMECLIEGNVYSLKEREICIINQNKLHRIYTNKNCQFNRIEIDPSFFTSNQKIYDMYIKPVLTDAKFSHIILNAREASNKNIVTLMDEIGKLETEKPDAYELIVIGIVHEIFQRLYTLHKSRSSKQNIAQSYDSSIYQKMSEYIYQNYSKNISLDDIANAGGVSKSKCCILFKKYAQNSPINFLNMYRLEISTKMLLRTSETILSIALSCGFGQASYYNRLFLKTYGMTPKQYRKMS